MVTTRRLVSYLAVCTACAVPAVLPLQGARAASPAAPPSGVVHRPVSTQLLADGGTAATFDFGGLRAQYLSPPASFDVLHASAAALARYGVPARPNDATKAAQWAATVGRAKFVSVPTQFVDPPGARQLRNSTIGFQSGNWAGYIDNNPQANYIGAQMTYVEPSAQASANQNCTTQQAESQWAGVGGVSDNTLYQSGTSWAPGTNIGLHQGWWEVIYPGESISASAAHPLAITPAVGDAVYTSFTYNAGGSSILFYFADLATNQSTSVNVTGVPAMGSATAEWIAERPEYVPSTGAPYFSDLANFGTLNIASAYSQPAVSAFPAATDPADDPSQAPVSQTMTDNGTVLADSGSFRDQTAFPPPAPNSYNGGFPVNWFNCQTTGTAH